MKIIHISHDDISFARFVEPLVISSRKCGFNVKSLIVNKNNFIKSNDQNFLISNYLTFNPLQFFKAICNLITLIFREKPDVIQTHSTLGSVIPLFISFCLRIPIRIYHNHGIPHLGYSGLFKLSLKILEYVNIFFSTQVITVSPAMRSELQRLAPSKDIFCFLPGSSSGLENNWFQQTKSTYLRDQFRINKKTKILLFVGRPNHRKGFYNLLDAFSKINLDVCLFLVGITKKDIPKQYKNLKKIIALGIQKDMLKIYRSSDVLISPSLHEGFGYAILEAAASMNALLVSNIPGPDAIIDKNCGYLFDPTDVNDIRAKINMIFSNDEKLKIFKKQAYKKACQFKSSIITTKYVKFLKKL